MVGNIAFIGLLVVVAIVIFGLIIGVMGRYKRCPSDKILVIYGKISGKSASKCIHGGAAFVWPLFQSCEYMDLTPIQIDVPLQKALSKQNIRIDVPSTFTIGISTDAETMSNAAERLLGLEHEHIRDMARDIIFGQLRVVVATMDIEDINANREKFISNVKSSLEVELQKVGLRLINVNVKDLQDESGYIEALGKEAAARAINEAKKNVAEKDRDGEIGKAQAEREQRIKVAEANAKAVGGENEAKVSIANSNASRREAEAEAERKAIAAEKVQSAKALEEAYAAEQAAELKRAERERASQNADIVVPAEIAKARVIVEADAEREKRVREAAGEGEAIFNRMEGEARGILEILSKQAEGLRKLVDAAGGDPKMAATLMIVEKLPELVKIQVEAIQNLKIGKVVVWDSVGDGTPTTSKFLSGMMKSIPPLNDLFDLAGMNLPDVLGKKKEPPDPITGEKITIK